MPDSGKELLSHFKITQEMRTAAAKVACLYNDMRKTEKEKKQAASQFTKENYREALDELRKITLDENPDTNLEKFPELKHMCLKSRFEFTRSFDAAMNELIAEEAGNIAGLLYVSSHHHVLKRRNQAVVA